MQAPSLTLGVEEEYQIIDPKTRELTSYITQILEADHRFLEQVKPELHQSIVEVGTKVCRTPAEVRTELVNLRGAVMELAGAQRPQDRRGRDASVLVLDEAGDHPARALPGCEGGHAGPGSAAPHLRHPRAHRDRGPGVPDRRAQRLALLPAAHPLPLDQLAVLERPQHRAQVVPQHRVPRLPPDRRAPDHPQLVRVRELPGDADLHRVHPQRLQDLVGRPARTGATRRWSSGSATCAPGWTRRSRWPRSCKPSWPSCGRCGATTSPSGPTRPT